MDLSVPPICTHCSNHPSERYCIDCSSYLCPWCTLSLHEPIGLRHHERPRLFGQDYHEELNRRRLHTLHTAAGEATKTLKYESSLDIPGDLASVFASFGAWAAPFMERSRAATVATEMEGRKREIVWNEENDSGQASADSENNTAQYPESAENIYNSMSPSFSLSAASTGPRWVEILLEYNPKEYYYRFVRVLDTTQDFYYTDHESCWSFEEANENDRLYTRLVCSSQARPVNDTKEDLEKGRRALEKCHQRMDDIIKLLM